MSQATFDVLFIGGPLDRERKLFDRLLPFYEVVRQVEMRELRYRSAGDFPDHERGVYRLVSIKGIYPGEKDDVVYHYIGTDL